MKNISAETILNDVDELRNNFINCRAYFPYMSENDYGSSQLITAPYYLDKGFQIVFNFNQPLTINQIKQNNKIGHWINQSVIVHLYSLLEYYDIVSEKIKIDQNVEGWKEIDILRRLRNIFSHKSSKYNPDDKKERTLLNEIISHFKLNLKNLDDFPLNIDQVIDPIFDGCKKYVMCKLDS